jgi:hypothetical protein
MRPFRRAVLAVCDGLSRKPDAAVFGDQGRHLGHVLASTSPIPNLAAWAWATSRPRFTARSLVLRCLRKMAEGRGDTATGTLGMTGLISGFPVP